MLNQNDTGGKFENIKGKFKNFFHKFNHKSEQSIYDQADGSRGEISDFDPEDKERSSTAPENNVILSDGTSDAQKLVWENENASMPGKAYSFDEETTDADYDTEDDLEFPDSDSGDGGSGQTSRYS